MTRKNAKKTAARARQEKTGQSYQSALRTEGGMTREAELEKRMNEAFTALNSGLYHGGIHTPTRENLMGRIQQALTILAGPIPQVNRTLGGGFDHDAALKDLELPEATRKNWELWEKFYQEEVRRGAIKHTTPDELMNYWRHLPETKRIIDSKRRFLGVTDDHPDIPLIVWVTLTSTKSCEGFGPWWESLPKSTWYDRFQPTVPPIPTSAIFRAQHPGEPLPPGMQEMPWDTDTMTPGPTGKVLITVRETGANPNNCLSVVLPKIGNDKAMFDAIDGQVKSRRRNWTGWMLVSVEPLYE